MKKITKRERFCWYAGCMIGAMTAFVHFFILFVASENGVLVFIVLLSAWWLWQKVTTSCENSDEPLFNNQNNV